MSEKLRSPGAVRRRAGVFASLAATWPRCWSPASALLLRRRATKTAWIPLDCGLAGSIPVPLGAIADRDLPDTVAPGGQFNIIGVHVEVIFPPAAQQWAGGRSEAECDPGDRSPISRRNLAKASTVNFCHQRRQRVDPVQPDPVQLGGGGAAAQQAAASNLRINGGDTTRGGFQPATPAESFSFGDIPADTQRVLGQLLWLRCPASAAVCLRARARRTPCRTSARSRPVASGSVIIKVANRRS